MAGDSWPGQLASKAFIAIEAPRSSVDNPDDANTTRIESQQILTKQETSKALQSGSFVGSPDDGRTHKQREQRILDSNDSAGCRAACAESWQLASHKEDPPFPCSNCVDKFKRRELLTRHKKSCHSADSTSSGKKRVKGHGTIVKKARNKAPRGAAEERYKSTVGSNTEADPARSHQSQTDNNTSTPAAVADPEHASRRA